jgi:hypothetical protein
MAHLAEARYVHSAEDEGQQVRYVTCSLRTHVFSDTEKL